MLVRASTSLPQTSLAIAWVVRFLRTNGWGGGVGERHDAPPRRPAPSDTPEVCPYDGWKAEAIRYSAWGFETDGCRTMAG